MTPASYLDAHTSDLVDLLRRLVQVETINPPGKDYDRMTALLARELRAAGLQAQRLTVPAALQRRTLTPDQHPYPRFNVVGFWPSRKRQKTLHFNAHYDVVPVSGEWAHGSPFSGQEEDGWIYGRGTGDMKGSIASLLLALKALRATNQRPSLNVEVSFTADEETDSALGAGWLVKHAPIRPDYAIVMEGGDGNSVCCGHNGVVWLDVVVHGKAAHGSRPQDGINAFEKMAALTLALEDYKRDLSRRRFETPEGKVMTPTLNLGGVFAQGRGGKINTVPAQARFSIDRRVLAIESVDKAERELRAFLLSAAREIPQCKITIEKVSDNHPCYTPPTDPFFEAMASAVKRVRRRPTVFNVSTGFNDMHFFSHYLKIPTLGYGPSGQNYHGLNERARIRDLVTTAKIYAELLLSFTGDENSASIHGA